MSTGAATHQGGTDTLISIKNIVGTDYNDDLTGDDGANILFGLRGIDSLRGGGGNDTLISGISGATASMYGGDGNDLYVINNATDTVTELSGEGFDTVRIQSRSMNIGVIVDFSATANIERFEVALGSTGTQVNGAAGPTQLITGAGDDVIMVVAPLYTDAFFSCGQPVFPSPFEVHAGDGNDAITFVDYGYYVLYYQTSDALIFDGGAGNDVLTGGPGGDVLIGETGADTMTGGGGSGIDWIGR